MYKYHVVPTYVGTSNQSGIPYVLTILSHIYIAYFGCLYYLAKLGINYAYVCADMVDVSDGKLSLRNISNQQ